MTKPPVDPLRTKLLELIQDINDRTAQLREYASNPGDAWLAKSELQSISLLMNDLESLLEQIKQADAENGY